MCVHSKAFVASSWFSNCTNAKFRRIRTLRIFPYGSKCLSMSRTLVRIGSKLMTNKDLVGLWFAATLESSRGRPRSPCQNKDTNHSSYINSLLQLQSYCLLEKVMSNRWHLPNLRSKKCKENTFAHSTDNRRLSYPNGMLSRLRMASAASRSSSK